ncbi:MAG: sigma 54-interacting transcriptional regulator, partial [Firmicutes bacterium]|nr:sigma 54-interacting transcriptional regulator [Bacillota bacterium]
MARPRMVVISPLPELSELTRRICRELNYQIDIVDGFLGEGVAKAIEYQEKKADVIISRGPTGILIQKKVSIPVILIQITTFDIMQALHRARKVGENIAYLEHVIRKDLYDFTLISEIMSIKKPRLFYYQNERQLEKQINRAKEEGIDVIIASGVCIIRMAREKGMEGVMIYSSREAVVEALQRAQEVVQIRQKDQEKNEFLQTIIDHTQTGVIAVDRHNIITHVSPVAGSLLKLKGSQLVGMPIKKVGHPFLLSFFQDSTPLKGEVHRMGNSKVLVNKLPICVGNCYLGLVLTMQEVNRIQNLEAIIRKELYAKGLTARYSLSDIVGKSPQIKKTVERARKFARSDSTILITGESGTGKELFAHGIHKESSRSQGPFVAINCAALPKDLLESELFGYVEGAFTGAKKGGKAGLFELAHMGTILLDEVSELSLPLQSNLLRVLQEKAVRRIG